MSIKVGYTFLERELPVESIYGLGILNKSWYTPCSDIGVGGI